MPTGPNGFMNSVGTTTRIPKADPRREYVTSTVFDWSTLIYNRMAGHAMEMVSTYGDPLINSMMQDYTVSACINTLKAAILADGIQIVPSYQRDPELDVPEVDSVTGEVTPTTPDPDQEREQEESDDIHEFCQRSNENMEEDLEAVAWALLDAIPYGCQLAEKVLEDGTGEDAGRLILKKVPVKTRAAWNFLIDDIGNVIGYTVAMKQRSGERPELPASKFVRFSWLPKGNDPRGTSAVIGAYEPWNEKVLARPERWKYISCFGSPFLFGTTSETAHEVPEYDDDGNETGNMLTPQEAMLAALIELPKKKAAAAGYGADVKVLNPLGNGEVFRYAFDQWDSDIAVAILGQIRKATGSASTKNDADTPQDDLAAFARVGKRALACALREQLYRPLVAMNFGEEAAKKYTPIVRLGMVDLSFFSRVANAVAKLATAGVIPPSAYPDVIAWLGLDSVIRRPLIIPPMPVKPQAPKPDSAAS